MPQSSLAEAPLKLILAEEFSHQLVKNRLLKDNAITYVAGFLLRKSFTKHDCQTCRSFFKNDSLDDDRKVFMFFKAYESDSNAFGGLVVPSKVMIDYVIKLEDTLVGKFQDLNILQGIGRHLLKVLEKEIIDIPCSSFPRNYMLKLVMRMRIHYSLKYTNRKLASSKRKNRKFIKVAHL